MLTDGCSANYISSSGGASTKLELVAMTVLQRWLQITLDAEVYNLCVCNYFHTI